MSLSKYRLSFPKFEPQECRGLSMREVLEEIKYSRNCLVIYQADKGQAEYLFTGFDEDLMATVIVLMSVRPKLHQFLKLAVVINDKLKKSAPKGTDLYNEAIKFIKTSLSNENPSDG
jgi:hypothetical protein